MRRLRRPAGRWPVVDLQHLPPFKLGGIPHDKYDMITLSVREYVSDIQRKLGLDETQVRKLQTGGPDCGLVSNKIPLGKKKYVHGDVVLVDPIWLPGMWMI